MRHLRHGNVRHSHVLRHAADHGQPRGTQEGSNNFFYLTNAESTLVSWRIPGRIDRVPGCNLSYLTPFAVPCALQAVI